MNVEIFPRAGVTFPGRKQQWYVRLRGDNGETLATSEAYVTKFNAKRAAAKNFPGLPVKEVNA